MDAKFAGFVAGGGNDAALVGAAADDNGLAAKIGALEEFDGDEEGVHINMEDGGVGGSFRRIGGVVLGSEAREVRHGISVRLREGGDNERRIWASTARVRRVEGKNGPPGKAGRTCETHFGLNGEAFME
jgi:hypothetical protein